jgi:hypothetical protein
MKIGLFEHTELVIDTKNGVLMHKETGFWADYKKCDDEMENLKNFQRALKSLEIRYGLYLIDKL